MAKYIKREMVDMNGQGKSKAYYQLKTYGHLNSSQFIEKCCSHGGGLSRASVVGALTLIAEELANQLADGYTVTLDGIGTFSTKIGVRNDKAQDSFETDEEKRNSRTIEVKNINFRADSDLIWEVDRRCILEKGGESRLKKSSLTPEERLEKAREYLAKHGMMRVMDYVTLTGLSRTTASLELRRLAADPDSGITSSGRKSSKVYLPSRS